MDKLGSFLLPVSTQMLTSAGIKLSQRVKGKTFQVMEEIPHWPPFNH